MQKEAEERVLRKTYSEIVNGFSVHLYNGKNIYIKHTNTLDNLEIDYLFTQYYEDAVSKKYPTETERLNQLKIDRIWSDKKQEEIDNFSAEIKSLFDAKRKAFRPSDISSLKTQIKEKEKELATKLTNKELIVGSTAEKFARRKVDAYFISKSFYKDRKLEELLFDEEEFNELYSSEVEEIYNIYYQITANLSDANIKKIALCDFFLNVFHLADNLYYFFGRPISSLTFYQIQLCAYGNFFKQVLSSEPKPPEEILSDPEKLEDWHFGRANAEEELARVRKDGNESASLVGLSKEDREMLGYENVEKVPMLEKIRAAGGEIPMEELIKIDIGEGD